MISTNGHILIFEQLLILKSIGETKPPIYKRPIDLWLGRLSILQNIISLLVDRFLFTQVLITKFRCEEKYELWYFI